MCGSTDRERPRPGSGAGPDPGHGRVAGQPFGPAGVVVTLVPSSLFAFIA